MQTAHLIAEIYAIETPEDIERVDALIRDTPGPMAHEVQEALMHKLNEVTAKNLQLVDDTKTTLALHGVNYDLDDWLTPIRYAERFDVSKQVVNNWISRGVIPTDHIKDIPELGLKLIKAVSYSPGKKDA